MAPKGLKRSAEDTPRDSKRKKSTADPVKPKCKDVEKAINMAEALTPSCKQMLIDMVGSSLTIYAGERHSYQTKAVQMLGETVAAVQKQMQNAVAQSQATVDNSDREKATREATLKRATSSLAELEQKRDASKSAVDDGKAALATAKAALAAAGEAVESHESEIADMTKQKATLETTLKDLFEPMKASKSTGRMKDVHTLEKVFTDCGLEAGLIEHVPETLRKDPEKRRTFDLLVVKHVDEQAAQYLAKAEGAIQQSGQKTTHLADAKVKSDAACTAAAEKMRSCSEAQDAAQVALKEGQAALKAAQSAMSGFEEEISDATEALDDAKNTLVAFTEGPCESFAALRDIAPPPEPEPEVVEEPIDAAAVTA